MNHHHVRYLLVGGGVASSSAAVAIRALDVEGELLLIAQEAMRPYHRPPLSQEFLRGRMSREELFAVNPAWFAAHRVELRTGEQASHLDTARRTMTLASGLLVSFDKLLLATGSGAIHLSIPGAELPSVYYLRTVSEAERLRHAIEIAKTQGQVGQSHGDLSRRRGRACLIGGGIMGVELAAAMAQAGLAVDVIETGPHPCPRFAGVAAGRCIARTLEQMGTTFHFNTTAQRFEGDGRVQRVVLADSSALPCDLVVVCIGAVAKKELLRGTPITAEKAILVDDHCRTNVPDIYAAGSCCALLDPLFGKHRWLENHDDALRTGAIAGQNMAGADAHYDGIAHFSSNLGDLSLSNWGEGRWVERRLLRGTAPHLVEIGVDGDGHVAQVLALGNAGQDKDLGALVAQRLRVDGIEESLKDPSVRLEALLGKRLA